MTLNQLYYFQTLAKELHYRIASESLNIAQPSLTYAIQELENELGVKLFHKRGRNIVLSNEGRRFLVYVDEALAKLEEGISKISLQKVIEIAVIPTIVPRFVKFLRYYNSNHPEIVIHFYSEKSEEIRKGIADGKYDLGICSFPSEGGFESIPVSKEELVIIVPEGHRLAGKKSVSLKELENEQFICYRKNLHLYSLIKKTLDHYNVAVNEVQYLDDEISIASMVGDELGVSIVANNESIHYNNGFIKINIEEKYHPRKIYAVYKDDNINETSLAFVNTMVEYCNNKYDFNQEMDF